MTMFPLRVIEKTFLYLIERFSLDVYSRNASGFLSDIPK